MRADAVRARQAGRRAPPRAGAATSPRAGVRCRARSRDRTVRDRRRPDSRAPTASTLSSWFAHGPDSSPGSRRDGLRLDGAQVDAGQRPAPGTSRRGASRPEIAPSDLDAEMLGRHRPVGVGVARPRPGRGPGRRARGRGRGAWALPSLEKGVAEQTVAHEADDRLAAPDVVAQELGRPAPDRCGGRRPGCAGRGGRRRAAHRAGTRRAPARARQGSPDHRSQPEVPPSVVMSRPCGLARQAQALAAGVRVLEVEARAAGRIAPVQGEQQPGVDVGVELDQRGAALAAVRALDGKRIGCAGTAAARGSSWAHRPDTAPPAPAAERGLVGGDGQAEDSEHGRGGRGRDRRASRRSSTTAPSSLSRSMPRFGRAQRAADAAHGTATKITAISPISTRLTRSRSANTSGSSCMRARCAISHM